MCAYHALHLAHWAGRCFNCRCPTFPTTTIVSQISRALLVISLSLFLYCMYYNASLYRVKFCLIWTHISGTISQSYSGVSRDGWWLYWGRQETKILEASSRGRRWMNGSWCSLILCKMFRRCPARPSRIAWYFISNSSSSRQNAQGSPSTNLHDSGMGLGLVAQDPGRLLGVVDNRLSCYNCIQEISIILVVKCRKFEVTSVPANFTGAVPQSQC